MESLLFEMPDTLWQVVRPCTDNGIWKKGLEVYGSKKDCEAYIRLESPAYIEPKFKIEPYNEANWSDTETCVITARDFKSLKAEEQVKYLKLSYDKRKLIREMVKQFGNTG